MSIEVTKMFAELEKSLTHCLIRDRHPVRSALRRIEKEPLDKQQKQLAKLVSRIEKVRKRLPPEVLTLR